MKVIKALTALACVLCVSVSGRNELVNLFKTDIRECIEENEMLLVKHEDESVGLILTMVQNAEAVPTVMECTSLRVGLDTNNALHNKSMFFDINAFTTTVMTTTNETRLDDWNCLQGRLETSQCFEMTPFGENCSAWESLLTANATCTQLLSTWNCTGAVKKSIQYFVNFVMARDRECLQDTSDIGHINVRVPAQFRWLRSFRRKKSRAQHGTDRPKKKNDDNDDQENFNSNVNFDNVNVDNVNFDNVNVGNANFDNVNFNNVNFDNVNYDNFSYHNFSYDNYSYDNYDQDNWNGAGSNKVALTLTFVQLAVGFVAELRQCKWTL